MGRRAARWRSRETGPAVCLICARKSGCRAPELASVRRSGMAEHQSKQTWRTVLSRPGTADHADGFAALADLARPPDVLVLRQATRHGAVGPESHGSPASRDLERVPQRVPVDVEPPGQRRGTWPARGISGGLLCVSFRGRVVSVCGPGARRGRRRIRRSASDHTGWHLVRVRVGSVASVPGLNGTAGRHTAHDRRPSHRQMAVRLSTPSPVPHCPQAGDELGVGGGDLGPFEHGQQQLEVAGR
jgi:hypothetical protein